MANSFPAKINNINNFNLMGEFETPEGIINDPNNPHAYINVSIPESIELEKDFLIVTTPLSNTVITQLDGIGSDAIDYLTFLGYKIGLYHPPQYQSVTFSTEQIPICCFSCQFRGINIWGNKEKEYFYLIGDNIYTITNRIFIIDVKGMRIRNAVLSSFLIKFFQ